MDNDKFPYIKVGNSDAKPIKEGSVEYTKDTNNFTNPNLHRRILNDEYRDKSLNPYNKDLPEQYQLSNDYTLSIRGKNSYRTVTSPKTDIEFSTDDEDAITEIP